MISKKSHFFNVVTLSIALSFFVNTIFPSSVFAQALPSFPFSGYSQSAQSFTPPIMTGIQLDSKNPFLFKFFVDPGGDQLQGQALDNETQKMVKYFLAALTIPQKNLWVNLSPYEQQRVIDEKFGQTDMGLDLLAQDYLLKQATASLVRPDSDLGKEFWTKVYQKAYELYGRTDINFDALNKVWIVPDKAVIYQQGSSAFIVESSLKVMLEKDYLAMNNQGSDALIKNNDVQGVSNQIMRDVVIPELQKKINTGRDFASLRQIYHALILADWFKRYMPQNLVNKVYVGENKVSGIASYTSQEAKNIYGKYVQAYQAGVHHKVIAEYDEHLKKYIPRKYFSGGAWFADIPTQTLMNRKDLSSSGLQSLSHPVVEYTILQNPVIDSARGEMSSPIVQDEFLSAENTKRIFDNEFAVREFVRTIPSENRAWHMENLKNWMIENAPQQLSEKYSGGIRWDIFMNNLLPNFEFSDEQVLEIIDRFGIGEKALDMPVDSIRPQEWQWMESLSNAIWPYGQVIAENLIAYLRLQKKEQSKKDFGEAFKSGQIFKSNIIKLFAKTRDSYKLLPYLRQIAKDTFFLASSKTERIDQLMRIAEKEVNVSTHKGQDLLNLSDLKKILESNHQRRKTGPNATYDPEVTAALEELKAIAESLADQTVSIFDDIRNIIDEYGNTQIQADLRDAEKMFQEGKKLDMILLLTKIRSQINPLLVERVQEADRIFHSDERQYGPHIAQSAEIAQVAYKLMEADILIEQKIVDFSTEAFSLIRENLNVDSLNVKNIQDMISAIYIIAKNMANALGAKPGLNIVAENLIKMKDKQQYTKMDYYKIYGMVQQVQFELDDMSAYLAKEFKPRVELLQKKQGVVDYQDTPESLGFVQDLLRTTMLGQFNERFLLDCRKTIDLLEGPEELALKTDSYAQQRVREILDIPLDFDSFPRIMGPEQATEGQMKRIGSKVYGLSLMKKLGLPIPDFFLIRSATGESSFKVDPIKAELQKQIAALEKKTGKKVGDPSNPLLFSLRSVFPISMPGDFPTVLNAGMNDEIFEGLKKIYGEEFALFTYIRFLQDWAVLFSDKFSSDEMKAIEVNHQVAKGQVGSLRTWLAEIKDILSKKNIKIPEDPFAQIETIADRIMNHSKIKEIPRDLALYGAPDFWKPSVIFQEMDFGYLEKDSYTAVVYSRNRKTGENKLYTEAMYGATGVDLVGLNRSKKEVLSELPAADQELVEHAKQLLEKALKGPVEFEITRGKQLHFLQTRVAHLDPGPMIKVLGDLVQEGILSQDEVTPRIKIFQSIIDQDAIIADKNTKPFIIAGGLAGGVMAGRIALSLEKAEEFMVQGQNASLVLETTPERKDKSYYPANKNVMLGVITAHGGGAQHFSIWAIKYHMPYISMINDIEFDLENQRVKLGGKWFQEGDVITMDGYRGLIFEGDIIKKENTKMSSPMPQGEAEGSSSNLGGIDLTETFATIHIKTDDQGLPLPTEFQIIQEIKFDGLVPVIIEVAPSANVPAILGLELSEPLGQQAVL